jgi:hypothetical protein
VGMTGWTVNSIAKAVKGSSPFLPKQKFFIDILYEQASIFNAFYWSY